MNTAFLHTQSHVTYAMIKKKKGKKKESNSHKSSESPCVNLHMFSESNATLIKYIKRTKKCNFNKSTIDFLYSFYDFELLFNKSKI